MSVDSVSWFSAALDAAPRESIPLLIITALVVAGVPSAWLPWAGAVLVMDAGRRLLRDAAGSDDPPGAHAAG
ncbi:hypothetical protein [Gordonia rhizosphera]|uniref:Uncharacterized protein n=1 Tax=Gordonia rhizosphera NBRC 16068 TaxID=1108045 RepID=K6WNQ7_9ACTN|nr:hypothetical protein [Gordonia rhizosphera]GAB88169.1 hypothetical protein GORHZ_006_00380 [Gordonia rhizosphera NBRC 16068]